MGQGGLPVLTPRQAGELLSVSGSTIRRWCATGELPALRVGGRYRIEEIALERMVAPAGPESES